ncbi:hypothetical protein LCGC14_1027730 [marine sediment metagenome]|uniref:Uncharacterized protein n=1 Tax=marine sediment metagenome TaxID=412755 RepID=A0A0F9R1I6_9ZZZZ
MSAQKPEKIEKPEELLRAEQLSDEGKLDEALTLLINYEQKEGLSNHDKASCHLLQCQILFWQGKLKELIKHAEQAYKESDGLENNFIKVDSLLLTTQALIRLGKFDEASDLITQGEEFLKTIPQQLTKTYKQREASFAYLKGYFYNIKSNPNDVDLDLALKHLEHSLALREELGIKHEIAESLAQMAWILCAFKGEPNRALKYAERSLAIAKESSKIFYIARFLHVMAQVHSLKGELDHSIRFDEQSLELFKKLNNKERMASVLNNLSDSYKRRGELDRALECIEQSMALNRELERLGDLANNYDFLIQILIDKGDLERAQISLHDMEQLNNKLKDKFIDLMYLSDKALVLKTSLRARDRGKAEEILTQLLEDENIDYEGRYTALLPLCELLLTELRITNDQGVLDELTQFIGQLLEIAEKTHSYWILCETYLLQAKLSLLTFNIKKAQRFLTQAHQIAERFDLNLLAKKIATETEDLLKKLDLWERLKGEDAPMSDRMELARLDEKIVKIILKRPVLSVQVSEEKIAISKEKKICLVCRGEVFGFSYICKCGAMYCENCAQALSNLENVCWACDVPIDYSKPSKPYMEEEEHIKVQEKTKKK